MSKLGRDIAAILVRRSLLDPGVWFCMPVNLSTDQSDWAYPGGLRAVKRHAEEKYGEGSPVQWERENADTWAMTLTLDDDDPRR